MHLYRSTRKESPLSRHFLKVMVHLSMIRILRLPSASEICTAGLVGFKFLLDSGLHGAVTHPGGAVTRKNVPCSKLPAVLGVDARFVDYESTHRGQTR
jgi:hypothetical protein